MKLLEKIQDLKKKYVQYRGDKQDIDTLDGWMEEAKRLMLLKSLKDHDGVKYVIAAFGGEIRKIDDLLKKSYSKDLNDRERDRLLDKKDLAKKYLGLFTDVEKYLEKLENIIDEEQI